MPTNERVRRLIQDGESGWTDEQEFFTRVTRVNENRTVSLLVDRDQRALHWIPDVTNPAGRRLRLDAIASQLWRGNKITEERFVHDSHSVVVNEGQAIGTEESTHAGR